MIDAKVVSNIKLPKIALQENLVYIANKVIIPDMQRRLKKGQSIEGGAMPALEESTAKRKGHSKQLQDMGILVNSFMFKEKGKNRVDVFISSAMNRDLIGSYLQNGIRSNKGIKKYKFFGISLFAERKAMDYMRGIIKRLTSGR